jgi:two-component system cell cycle sensor histidine kinase/response regulator CckA
MRTRCDPSLKSVKADPFQIEQVLLNLSLNARDAMPNGGTLEFEAVNYVAAESVPLPSSSLTTVPPGDYVLLTVRDNGMGMPREVVAQAFDPFFTTKDLGKGTGLGLSVVYSIVKQNNGFVWIDTVPGQGTAVSLLLPAALDVDVAQETRDDRRGPMRGTGRILLVEDEDEVRAFLGEWLVEAGYSVIEFSNGREALAAFESGGEPIDVIVTDVVMPHASGPSLVRAARSLHPGLKALYMSGYADETMVSEIEHDSHSAYLQKPFGRETLLHKVSGLFEA